MGLNFCVAGKAQPSDSTINGSVSLRHRPFLQRQVLSKYYQKQRISEGRSTARTTIRLLESMVRRVTELAFPDGTFDFLATAPACDCRKTTCLLPFYRSKGAAGTSPREAHVQGGGDIDGRRRGCYCDGVLHARLSAAGIVQPASFGLSARRGSGIHPPGGACTGSAWAVSSETLLAARPGRGTPRAVLGPGCCGCCGCCTLAKPWPRSWR